MAIDWDAAVLAPCMSADVFGEGILYMPKGGAGAFQIDDAVFDDAFRSLVLLGAGEPGTATSDPRVGVRAAAFVALGKPLPVQGDQLKVLSIGVTFTVNNPEPDRKGHIVLELNKSKTQV